MKKYWIGLFVALAIVVTVMYTHNTTNPPAADNSASTPSAPAAPPTPPQAPAQYQPNDGYPFQDTSMLKPPAGAKVAIYEFEDLECPACAHASPVVHAAAAQYKVPIERHDYPWTFHIWSFDAAVTARYIQDKISPQLADTFRRDVFANQTRIESKDDLTSFTRSWFQNHSQTMPFVIDPDGTCRNEVEADHALGDRLGVKSTPSIFVVTQSKFIPVVDLNQLDSALESALTETGSRPAA